MTQQDIEQQGNKIKVGVLDRLAVTAWLLLGGLFLIAWPIVMFGGVFLFDAPGERPLPVWMFVLGVGIYPIVYFSCLSYAIAMLKTNQRQAGKFWLQGSFYACIPVLYVCILGGMAYLGFWMMGW